MNATYLAKHTSAERPELIETVGRLLINWYFKIQLSLGSSGTIFLGLFDAKLLALSYYLY